MRVEQLLHGYNNGHHLIAGSVALPLKDTDRMSYLSDWSGYVNPIDKDTSYISAYPLEESRCFVIARSWYADEMSRPGCVWTHSLVINTECLEENVNLYDLLNYFRRPKKAGDDFRYYTESVEIKCEGIQIGKDSLKEIDPTRLMFMVAGLLDRTMPMIYSVEKSSDLYMDLCMRLIQNIPYGILQELTICTGSSMVRKFEDKLFNLQFVVGKGESLIDPYPNTDIPLADKGFQFWLDSMLDGRNDVSQMIHKFSCDIGNDTVKFLAVSNLLKILNDRITTTDSNASIKDIILYLTKAFKGKNSGNVVKKAFLNESVSNLFCDEKDFIVAMATTTEALSFDYEKIGFEDRVNNYRKQHSSEEYIGLLGELYQSKYLNEEGRQLLVNALIGFSREELVEFANKNWVLFESIVFLNNKVLADDYWIDFSPTQFVSVFSIFQKQIPEGFVSWNKLYTKLLDSNAYITDATCQNIIKYVDNYLIKAFDNWNLQIPVHINKSIVALCMLNKTEVIKWMNQQYTINKRVRDIIKKNIQPDEKVVVKKGSAAWKVFVNEELANQKNANNLIYAYVLAFNWRDSNSLSYIKGVLPHIYEALSHGTLSYFSWTKIEKFTGKVPFWRSWDNCRKLLIGVRDYCKDMNLKNQDMENFTSNQKLNQELLDLWKNG